MHPRYPAEKSRDSCIALELGCVMKIAKMVAASAAASLCAALGGCASVMESSEQPIQVATAPEQGAACIVSNDRGSWPLTSPGTVTVKKSASVLKIDCTKPGYKTGTLYAAPKMSTTALVGLMMPYAGLVNAAVDSSSGAAQQYEMTYLVTMTRLPVAASAAAPTPTQAMPPTASANSSAH